jgi:hypothetical protein
MKVTIENQENPNEKPKVFVLDDMQLDVKQHNEPREISERGEVVSYQVGDKYLVLHGWVLGEQ